MNEPSNGEIQLTPVQLPKAKRFNEGKPKMSRVLSMPSFLEAIDASMREGDEKYGYNDWRNGGRESQEYFDSAMRHMARAKWLIDDCFALNDREIKRHLASAAWNLGAVIELFSENQHE